VIDEQHLVNSIVEFPRDKWKAHRWSPATWSEQLRTYRSLRQARFDWGIDLHGHSKTALALRIAKPKKRLSVEPTDVLAKRLNPIITAGAPTEHTVELNHRVLSTFGKFALPERPIMPRLADRVVDPKLITISVGAGTGIKMWPAENWRQIGKMFLDQGFEVALLGGPDDPRVELPGSRDYVAKLPLAMTLDLVSRSVLHMAADTGTGHMAAAYGVPVVSIFGASNVDRFRPYTHKMRLLDGKGSPANVPVEDVISAANELLEATCAS
jgi:ADP-heptose:LPS heptosyltransferase